MRLGHTRSIPIRINLGNDLFSIGSVLNVLGSALEWISFLWYSEHRAYFSLRLDKWCGYQVVTLLLLFYVFIIIN